MIKNYISENLEYIVSKSKVSMDDFGLLFDLKRGVIGQYIRKVSIPKLETIQRICLHFEITIDDFVNKDLSKGNVYGIKQDKILKSNEEAAEYLISPRYVERLEKTILDKDKIINMLEDKLALHEKNRMA